MIVAELLGVPMDEVTVVQSDTALVPAGRGTMGSRSLQIGGSAVYQRQRGGAREGQAARRAPARGGRRRHRRARRRRPRRRRRARHRAVSGRARAWPASDPARRPADMERGPARTSSTSTRARRPTRSAPTSRSSRSTPRPVGSSCSATSPSTTAGAILNPLLVAGQQHGGIAQGVAQALYEGVVYDDDGNPLTANLMDYAMPSAAELPSFEASNTETPTPLNPLGAKGIGESGTIGSTPAVQNAVVDALAHLGDPPHRHAAHGRAGVAGDPGRRHRLDRMGFASPTLRLAQEPVPRGSSRTATTASPTRRAALLAGPWSTGEAGRRGHRRCTRAGNADASARTYTVDSRDYLRGVARRRGARRRDHRRAGTRHTHTDAYPSPTDVGQAEWTGVDLRDREPAGRRPDAAGVPHPRRRGRRVPGRARPPERLERIPTACRSEL